MKKLISVALLAGLVTACNQANDDQATKETMQAAASATETKAATGSDSANTSDTTESNLEKQSYAIGAITASRIVGTAPGAEPLEIDKAALIKGFQDTVENKGAMNDEQLRFHMTEYQKVLQAAAQQKQQQLAAAGKEYLKQNLTKEGVKVTETGLQYKVLKEGDGKRFPKATDKVKVHYVGTLIDGTQFDSSIERGDPIEFPLNGVIPGWTEGVQLMSVGAKYQFFIPFELAYGAQGRPPTIPPSATLLFEVELLDINAEAQEEASAE